jgi:hypothetical protein
MRKSGDAKAPTGDKTDMSDQSTTARQDFTRPPTNSGAK